MQVDHIREEADDSHPITQSYDLILIAFFLIL